MVKVAEEMKIKSGALTEELHLTNLQTRAGSTRDQALRISVAHRSGRNQYLCIHVVAGRQVRHQRG